MIREMINSFEGIEFYRSTFNTETGDIVRITTEPDPNRRSWWRLEDEVEKEYFKKHPIDKTMAEKQQWDAQRTLHGEFQEKWKDQFGENSWHRSRAWSPSPETIDFAINDWCDVGCKNCVPPGTFVLTPDRARNIEDIKIGDVVYVLEHESSPSRRVEAKVEQKFEQDYVGELISVKLENGKTLELTPEHEVFTSNRGYVKSGELTENDDLVVF